LNYCRVAHRDIIPNDDFYSFSAAKTISNWRIQAKKNHRFRRGFSITLKH
jgi:hypothetical protein